MLSPIQVLTGFPVMDSGRFGAAVNPVRAANV